MPARLRTLSRTVVLLAAFVPVWFGCAGYQLGNRSLYRPDIHTVSVPIIQSDSLRRTLGERLTEAVVKEIELKTPYKVVNSLAADSVLTCRIVSERKRVLSETITDEPRLLETEFVVQVNWVDHRGGLIMEHSGIAVSPLALGITQTASFVPEAGQSIATAHQEALGRLAEQIVSQMEVGW